MTAQLILNSWTPCFNNQMHVFYSLIALIILGHNIVNKQYNIIAERNNN